MTSVPHPQRFILNTSPTLCFTPVRLTACCEARFRLVRSTPLQGAVTQPSDYLYKYFLSPSLTLFQFFPALSFQFCTPLLLSALRLFFLPLLTELSPLSPQCCKRKLVAMLMSLFEALRASSASILEKPISTNRATCKRGKPVDGHQLRQKQQINQQTLYKAARVDGWTDGQMDRKKGSRLSLNSQ